MLETARFAAVTRDSRKGVVQWESLRSLLQAADCNPHHDGVVCGVVCVAVCVWGDTTSQPAGRACEQPGSAYHQEWRWVGGGGGCIASQRRKIKKEHAKQATASAPVKITKPRNTNRHTATTSYVRRGEARRRARRSRLNGGSAKNPSRPNNREISPPHRT
jgi:hypothetical protein